MFIKIFHRPVPSLLLSLFRSRSSTVSIGKPLLTLYTKKSEPCSLCEDAKEILNKYSTEFMYEERYIDDPTHREWFDKYRYEIPVIHINGEFVMKHRVNERLLRKTLDSIKEKENNINTLNKKRE